MRFSYLLVASAAVCAQAGCQIAPRHAAEEKLSSPSGLRRITILAAGLE